MSDRSGWVGTVAVAGLAVICCAGPLLVVGVAGLGVGAWLAAHGLWLVGGFALLLTVAALVVTYRRRQASGACAVDEDGTPGSHLTRIHSEPHEVSDR